MTVARTVGSGPVSVAWVLDVLSNSGPPTVDTSRSGVATSAPLVRDTGGPPAPQVDGRGPIVKSSTAPLASRSCGRYVLSYGLSSTRSDWTYTFVALLCAALMTIFRPFGRLTVALVNSGEPIT